jgi:hypothetical protein
VSGQPESKIKAAVETAAGAGIVGMGCLAQCVMLALMVAVGTAVLKWLGVL